MRYNLYKLLHLVGVMTLFVGLAGVLWNKMVGVNDRRGRRVAAIFHGLGLTFLLVSGFGLLAVVTAGTGTHFPNWVIVKMLIWLALGGAFTLASRKGELGWPLAAAFILFGAVSAYMGVYKPI